MAIQATTSLTTTGLEPFEPKTRLKASSVLTSKKRRGELLEAECGASANG